MENLATYVTELLTTTDCVMVPNLGGFITIRKPAYVAENTFFPPSKELIFSEKLNYNDHLLIDYIADRSFVAHCVDPKFIEDSIAQLSTQIVEQTSVNFGTLGIFSKNSVGNLEFSAVASSKIPYPETFGLQKFQTSPIERTIETTVPLRNTNQFVKNIIAIAACVLFFIFPTLNSNQHTDTVDKASLVPFVMQEDAQYIDEEIEEIVDTSKTYHVIIASLPSLSRYEQYISETRLPDSATMVCRDGRYRVSIANSHNEKEINEYLEAFIQINPKFADAWILEIEE